MRQSKGFTLVELMVVILIVGILAGATIPLMRGRVNSAKWAEASATAGTIRSAVRVRFAEVGGDKSKITTGALDSTTIQNELGFTSADLTGTYFDPEDYTISSIDDNGNASVTVTAGDGDPEGTGTMSTEGEWSTSMSSD